MSDKDKKDVDQHSGVETTGHEWDGIKELNNPLPRWWLWVFYISIIWSIGYWVLYPAWPTWSDDHARGGTKGSLEWTQYTKLAEEQAEIKARRAEYLEDFQKASFDEIMHDEALYQFALAGGASAFKDNCATCHGTGGAGAPGYPNLNDDDWIWGGDMESIHQTILYGVRMHDDAHQSMMPAFGDMLDEHELHAVVEYVLGLHSGESLIPTGEEESLPLGAQVFADNCAACHGTDGTGDRTLGAPNLADAIWLKSEDGSTQAVMSQIQNPKHGMMPAWIDRLDEDTIRQLTIYVHSLGGGE